MLPVVAAARRGHPRTASGLISPSRTFAALFGNRRRARRDLVQRSSCGSTPARTFREPVAGSDATDLRWRTRSVTGGFTARTTARDPSQAAHFDGRGQPAVRVPPGEEDPGQWQADTFASHLLMPKGDRSSRHGRSGGNLDPVVLADLPPVTVTDCRDPADATLDRFSKPLAERFEVSAEGDASASKLGLLLANDPTRCSDPARSDTGAALCRPESVKPFSKTTDKGIAVMAKPFDPRKSSSRSPTRCSASSSRAAANFADVPWDQLSEHRIEPVFAGWRHYSDAKAAKCR